MEGRQTECRGATHLFEWWLLLDEPLDDGVNQNQNQPLPEDADQHESEVQPMVSPQGRQQGQTRPSRPQILMQSAANRPFMLPEAGPGVNVAELFLFAIKLSVN